MPDLFWIDTDMKLLCRHLGCNPSFMYDQRYTMTTPSLDNGHNKREP